MQQPQCYYCIADGGHQVRVPGEIEAIKRGKIRVCLKKAKDANFKISKATK